MEDATVSIRKLKDLAISIIDRVEAGEAITVTKNGHPVARILSANKPAKLRGSGKGGAEHVSESRR